MVIKAKKWPEKDLTGIWEISYKIDGVRVIIENNKVLSRAGKELPGLQQAAQHLSGDFEFFLDDFKTTISVVRTHEERSWGEIKEGFFTLSPADQRLLVGVFDNPSRELINARFQEALQKGHEGLILKQKDLWYKVKADYTADVLITGVQEGTGRNKNRLGALLTTRGKVGAGFTDEDREALWRMREELEGTLAEVSYMELTAAGKFRHPRFVRVRTDKLEETL